MDPELPAVGTLDGNPTSSIPMPLWLGLESQTCSFSCIIFELHGNSWQVYHHISGMIVVWSSESFMGVRFSLSVVDIILIY